MGSVGSGNNTITPQQEKALNKIANQIRSLKNERMRVVDSDGNIIFEKQGKGGEIIFTVGEGREYLSRGIPIHNHPIGGTFSVPDIRDFGYGTPEIWVSAPEGNYKLINTKYGTPEQQRGWMAMQEAYERDVNQDMSYLTLRNEAQKTPHIKTMMNEMSSISKEFMEKKNSGASQATLDALGKKYDTLEARYKTEIKKEIRRLEVEPNHEWLKKNASKYGFKYVFEEKKKKK